MDDNARAGREKKVSRDGGELEQDLNYLVCTRTTHHLSLLQIFGLCGVVNESYVFEQDWYHSTSEIVGSLSL